MRGGTVAAAAALVAASLVLPASAQDAGRIRFTAPKQLPGAFVGWPYAHSFCNGPQSKLHCGTLLVDAKNPSGGSPPYTFFKKPLTGSIPWGLKLSLNGLLVGTPTAKAVGTAASKAWSFPVCVKDNRASTQCARNATRLIVRRERPLAGALVERVTEPIVTGVNFKSTGDGTFSATIAPGGMVKGTGEIKRTWTISGNCSIERTDSATVTVAGTASPSKGTVTLTFAAPQSQTPFQCGGISGFVLSPALRFTELEVTLPVKKGATYEDAQNEPCNPGGSCLVRVTLTKVA